jgi:hypothetical protein
MLSISMSTRRNDTPMPSIQASGDGRVRTIELIVCLIDV